MERAATPITRPAIKPALRRWGAWLRAAWHDLTLDADERFLGEARDFADLERRLERLERGRPDRYAPLDPGA
jgi:hypothetical protein